MCDGVCVGGEEVVGPDELGDDVAGEISAAIVREPVEDRDPTAHREIIARRFVRDAALAAERARSR
jgi:hypothetical protein